MTICIYCGYRHTPRRPGKRGVPIKRRMVHLGNGVSMCGKCEAERVGK